MSRLFAFFLSFILLLTACTPPPSTATATPTETPIIVEMTATLLAPTDTPTSIPTVEPTQVPTEIPTIVPTVELPSVTETNYGGIHFTFQRMEFSNVSIVQQMRKIAKT